MQSVDLVENNLGAIPNRVVKGLALARIGEMTSFRLAVFGRDCVFGVDSHVVTLPVTGSA